MATDPSALLARISLGGTQGQGTGNNPYLDQQRGLAEAQQNQNSLAAQAMALNAQRSQQQQQASYQHDVQSYFSDPRPERLGALILKYPQQADAIKASKAALDEPARQSQLTQYGQLYSAAQSGRTDLLIKQVTALRDAEKAQGIDTSEADDVLGRLQSGDKDAAKQVLALSQVHIAALDPKFADALTKVSGKGDDTHVITPGGALVDNTGKELYRAAPSQADAMQVPIYDENGKRVGTQLIANGGKGGGPASSGGAAGTGDVSRLINSDAGGGYVPDGVKTLGQFVGFGKSLNQRGAKSSSAGTYQINGSTMAEFAPQALGAGWKNAPFNADSQEKVGEAIFNWAKLQPNPAAALRGRWVSLSPQKAAQLVQGDWQQARGAIAQGETGGGSGASADQAAGGNNGYIGPVGASSGAAAQIKPGDITSVPQNIRGAVQAIADGRAAAPRAGTRNGEAILDAVTAYDPTFDAANATSRLKTRTDFTSGSSAKSITAMNTAMGHLMHLDDQAHDLGNFSTLPGLINPLYNSIRSAAGNTSLPAFNQTKQAAASELRKVFAGAGGGNLHELEAFEANLDSSKSPEQLHAVIKNAVDLLSSRLTALRDQYSQGMGRSDTLPTFIKPSIVRSAKQRFGIDLGNGDEATQHPASKPAPSSGWGRAQVVR